MFAVKNLISPAFGKLEFFILKLGHEVFLNFFPFVSSTQKNIDDNTCNISIIRSLCGVMAKPIMTKKKRYIENFSKAAVNQNEF